MGWFWLLNCSDNTRGFTPGDVCFVTGHRLQFMKGTGFSPYINPPWKTRAFRP
jgi:hypothetical protein